MTNRYRIWRILETIPYKILTKQKINNKLKIIEINKITSLKASIKIQFNKITFLLDLIKTQFNKITFHLDSIKIQSNKTTYLLGLIKINLLNTTFLLVLIKIQYNKTTFLQDSTKIQINKTIYLLDSIKIQLYRTITPMVSTKTLQTIKTTITNHYLVIPKITKIKRTTKVSIKIKSIPTLMTSATQISAKNLILWMN